MAPSRSVSTETFSEIVDIIEHRALHLVSREARVGLSSHVTGKARIKDEELFGRLGRLRDYVAGVVERATVLLESDVHCLPSDDLAKCLKVAQAALSIDRFSGLQEKSKRNRLMSLLHALDRTLATIDSAIEFLAAKIDSTKELQLLTLWEADIILEDHPDGALFSNLLRANGDLRGAREDTLAILKGWDFNIASEGGPYEKRRGRWITAQLFGMAQGLGLNPTRSDDAKPNTNLHSAADAVAIVIGRLLEKIEPRKQSEQKNQRWQTDPVVLAVVDELPRNRDNEFDPNATAVNIAKNFARVSQQYLMDAKNIGKRLGEVEISKNERLSSMTQRTE